MKKILFTILCLGCLIFCRAASADNIDHQTSEQAYYEVLKDEYIPQSTPQESYLLELKLLSEGMYCYDLPLFDPQWRLKGKKIVTSALFIDTAKAANQPFDAYIEDDHAVIYYPKNKSLSPVFFYQEHSKWVIDRTAAADRIFFDHNKWITLGGDYPYLNLLKKVYKLKEIHVDKTGLTGYQIAD